MTQVTSHIDLASLWDEALSWEVFIASAQENLNLWLGLYDLSHAPEDLVEEAKAKGPRHVLVIAEDWCGDASSTVPALVKFAEAVPDLDVRIIKRDEHPQVMDRYLTNGAKAIPVVIVLDVDFRETGWWGPRPAELQEWVQQHRDSLPTIERTRHSRGWYARDKGRSAIREILDKF